ncbi:MAG: hypothetical protein E6364_03220 [Staphylococcus sp.]|nr:hypothetical protein [Staphylococcus sp.]
MSHHSFTGYFAESYISTSFIYSTVIVVPSSSSLIFLGKITTKTPSS